MKSILSAASLFVAGVMAGNSLPPWQNPSAYETGDSVTVFTITNPSNQLQAHFACVTLTEKEQ